MQVIENEMICMFDVDETLVMERKADPWESQVYLQNPYTADHVTRVVHEKHLQLLRHMHGRGRLIGVWSGNGVKWAEAVVRALDIEQYVHVVMTKPIAYVDDYPAEQWLNNRIYLGGK